jgi:hypothetical protein
LPVRVVMALFRGKRLSALRQAWACGELTLPEARRPQQLLNLLNRLGQTLKTPWHGHMRECYCYGAGVVIPIRFLHTDMFYAFLTGL